MKNFALIGAAGYIAPRHMRAIKETGNELVCALDPYDGIGIMDSYFPEADFFTEPERFDRHLDKLRRQGKRKIDYVSICSPNYLHDAHIRMALRNDADAICEKPLVLNPWNLDALQEIEHETGKKIHTILQLRLHPAILQLREKVLQEKRAGKVFDVDLTYITSRGKWYFISWKGNVQKSGGVATNIGVHFFDMLGWIFGDFKGVELQTSRPEKMGGKLFLERANVNWFLSVDEADLPDEALTGGKRTFRKISIEGTDLEFSEGFTDLHTRSYEQILAGNSYGIEDARKSIEIVSQIRRMA
ncbi:MAG: Gfo/Idh/MocA family oxidoreductase [Prolixibacteraceae bacterium]|nr:Gfo/Idh/MocA family oxidoreductase [Prolixibacteraceae bacterium]HOS00917.1 Gfo/Idh/MocA family oxidoreductase [Prolixibacteraceae bacterium]HOS89394.1 Gfo/Idh/MocA family oxidoreductase [Prolixibacteraceae bacterium]HPL45981.1 Gfo/Idh/MocA family oxidoreductase [Prolixibacteraceae bacterium]HQE51199.1 Gfo/Idh/MocA family oxidoreductase [Prolixibacteraceae bacterium]